jgi:hypothetical protein
MDVQNPRFHLLLQGKYTGVTPDRRKAMHMRTQELRQAGLMALVLGLSPAMPAQSQTPLSAMDHIDIQQLVNRLNFALDYCTNGGLDFADLFVEGGRFVIDNGDGNPSVRDSHAALIALASGPDCEARRSAAASYILHLAESLVIEADTDGARGMSYAIYPASRGRYFSPEVAGQMGIYHDEYVKTEEGWRFRSRRHETNPQAGSLKLP